MLLEKSAEQRKIEVMARKTARKNNLLKVMGLQPSKSAAKRGAEENSSGPAEKRQKTEPQLSEPVSIKLESVEGNITGLIFKGTKVENPENSLILGKQKDFYLELDHPNLFENVRLRLRSGKKNITNKGKHIREWLDPVKIDGKFHYELGLNRFPDLVPSEHETETRKLEEGEIFVAVHEFNYMVKRKWYYSHHEAKLGCPLKFFNFLKILFVVILHEAKNANSKNRRHCDL